MASRAIFDVANAFFGVLGPDLVGLMFVTAITGVAREIAADMAGGAGGVVRSGQCEETGMLETRGLPDGLRMALCAVAAHLGMQRGLRRTVA